MYCPQFKSHAVCLLSATPEPHTAHTHIYTYTRSVIAPPFAALYLPVLFPHTPTHNRSTHIRLSLLQPLTNSYIVDPYPIITYLSNILPARLVCRRIFACLDIGVEALVPPSSPYPFCTPPLFSFPLLSSAAFGLKLQSGRCCPWKSPPL